MMAIQAAGAGHIGLARLERTDGSRLRRFFFRLSPETLYRRFHSPIVRPEQAQPERLLDIDHHDREAVVAAGKHAYCEKPVGVDVPQTRKALEIAKRAQGKVSVDVGFQIRSAPPFVEIVRRLHSGALGKLASITAYYNAPASVDHAAPGMSPETLRNLYAQIQQTVRGRTARAS